MNVLLINPPTKNSNKFSFFTKKYLFHIKFYFKISYIVKSLLSLKFFPKKEKVKGTFVLLLK